MSDCVWPHRRQPTRLPRPWDSPGKNTGVGCHFLLQCKKVKSESEVAQSCPTLRFHGLQPTRLLRPWDFPGKSTGVGCHRLLHTYMLDTYIINFTKYCQHSLKNDSQICILTYHAWGLPFSCILMSTWGVPIDSVVRNLPAMQETWKTQFQSLSRENPLEEEMATHSSILV